MDDEKKIKDIVAMLDEFMEHGGGHMNIQVENQETDEVKVDIYQSTDCTKGDTACKVPTIHKGIDDEEE